MGIGHRAHHPAKRRHYLHASPLRKREGRTDAKSPWAEVSDVVTAHRILAHLLELKSVAFQIERKE